MTITLVTLSTVGAMTVLIWVILASRLEGRLEKVEIEQQCNRNDMEYIVKRIVEINNTIVAINELLKQSKCQCRKSYDDKQ